MVKAFALVSLDGEAHTTSFSRESLESILNSHPIMAMGTEIVEIEYNNTPITNVGLEYKEKLRELMKDVTKFHFNKTVKFYELSADDRLKFIYDFLTAPSRPLRFFDAAGVHEEHVKEWDKREPFTGRYPKTKKPSKNVNEWLKERNGIT